jgi:hypothetical protein
MENEAIQEAKSQRVLLFLSNTKDIAVIQDKLQSTTTPLPLRQHKKLKLRLSRESKKVGLLLSF